MSRNLNCEVGIIDLIPLIFFAIIIFQALEEVSALLKDLPVALFKDEMILANNSIKNLMAFVVKTCSTASFIEGVFVWE